MRKIQIGYWHLSPIAGLPYKHMEEMEYTDSNLLSIIATSLAVNCSTMIRPTLDGNILVWIDKGRFGQQ